MVRLIAASTLGMAHPAWSAPAAFRATQEEQFAAAFGLSRPVKSGLCDPWFRLPEGSFEAHSEMPEDTNVLEPSAAVTPQGPDGAVVESPQLETAIAPRFLRSEGIPVRRTQYDERWRAVREAGLSAECARTILGSLDKPQSPSALLAFNRTVNGRVRYVADGRSDENDSWAIAADTLRAGAGDCEDVAILKLQLLLALGVSERDIYFTLVRDTIRKRDHAVVVIQSPDGPMLLDSVSDRPLDAAGNSGYQPVVAFSGEQKWLLGTERQAVNVPSWLRQKP